MCGFAGFCDEKMQDKEVNEYIVKAMTDKIRHRGPDDEGTYCDSFISLGFARLKIIDLNGGAQPMTSSDGRYVICFNGEIYNYGELKEEQIKNFGERFYTESDTEVLLSVMSCYGKKGLEKLRGMFSFALYDKEERTLMLVRDPFGIKPLYYGIFEGCFMFSSEIKAFTQHPKFKKELNSEILPYYLQFQYVPTEETAFKGVFRLMPGTYLTYKDGKAEKNRWFDMPVFEKNRYKGYSFFSEQNGETRTPLPYKKSSGEISERLLSVLDASVKRHMRSDVKVGGFLSGGVDSGLICALAEPTEAFTVGFKRADFDERASAMKTARELGLPLTSVEVDADDFFDAVEDVQYFSDEPYANLSAIPLYLLSKKASESVGVIISGEGADELFGGYEWYADSNFGKAYRALPDGFRRKAAKKALRGRIGDFLKRNAGNAEKDFIGQAKIMTEGEAYSVLADKYKVLKSPVKLTEPHLKRVEKASLLRKKMYLDAQMWLPFDILNKADKMTMAHSLELRVPYLDLAVFTVAQGCADRLLMRGKTGKYVLRKAAAKALDGEIAYRPKKGFPVPFRSWIRDKKYAKILENAFKGAIGREFFNTERLLEMLKSHVKGDQNNARVLYTVYAFIVWYEVYFVNEAQSVAVIETERATGAKLPSEKQLFDTQTKHQRAEKRGKIKAENNFEEVHTDNFRI